MVRTAARVDARVGAAVIVEAHGVGHRGVQAGAIALRVYRRGQHNAAPSEGNDPEGLLFFAAIDTQPLYARTKSLGVLHLRLLTIRHGKRVRTEAICCRMMTSSQPLVCAMSGTPSMMNSRNVIFLAPLACRTRRRHKSASFSPKDYVTMGLPLPW
jgi:hypothetical protein